MKYKVGDMVIPKSQLTILFNPYWKEEKRRSLIKIVTEATEDLFTIYDDHGRYDTTLRNALSCGANEYLAYRQESGNCYSWATRERLLHLESDKEEIRKIVEEGGHNNFQKDIERHESRIEYHKRQLQLVKDTYEKDLKINRELLKL